jgi:drug/metabolite transporter (DMT)-like permease
LIRVALTGFPPLLVVEGRILLGACVLLPIAASAGALRGWRELVLPTVVIAALEAALPFTLISYGERLVSSALAGLLIATVPLAVAGFAAAGLDPAERPTLRRLVGIVIGLAGVAAVLGLDLGGGSPLLGALMILGAAASYGLAALLIKRWFAGRHPLLAPTATVVIAAIAVAPVSAVAGGRPHATALSVLAILVLGLACTATAFVAYFALIAEAGPGRAAIVTYLNPLIAVGLGATILHEQLTIWTLVGFALILGGSAVVNLDGGRSPQTRGVVRDALRSG